MIWLVASLLENKETQYFQRVHCLTQPDWRLLSAIIVLRLQHLVLVPFQNDKFGRQFHFPSVKTRRYFHRGNLRDFECLYDSRSIADDLFHQFSNDGFITLHHLFCNLWCIDRWCVYATVCKAICHCLEFDVIYWCLNHQLDSLYGVYRFLSAYTSFYCINFLLIESGRQYVFILRVM